MIIRSQEKYHAIVYGNIKEEEGTVNAPDRKKLKRPQEDGNRHGWKTCSDAL